MFKRQYIAVIAINLLMVVNICAVAFDARQYNLDERVNITYDLAQAHPDTIHLSNDLIALYNQFQIGNYSMTYAQYLAVRFELLHWELFRAGQANAESMSQEYIDAHS